MVQARTCPRNAAAHTFLGVALPFVFTRGFLASSQKPRPALSALSYSLACSLEQALQLDRRLALGGNDHPGPLKQDTKNNSGLSRWVSSGSLKQNVKNYNSLVVVYWLAQLQLASGPLWIRDYVGSTATLSSSELFNFEGT